MIARLAPNQLYFHFRVSLSVDILHGHTFIKLVVVEMLNIVVGISTLSVVRTQEI